MPKCLQFAEEQQEEDLPVCADVLTCVTPLHRLIAQPLYYFTLCRKLFSQPTTSFTPTTLVFVDSHITIYRASLRENSYTATIAKTKTKKKKQFSTTHKRDCD